MKENPNKAAKEIADNPKILEILLSSDDQLEHERNEKIKYINMSQEMQRQLQEISNRLKISQGALIGAGVLFILSQFDNN